MHPSKNYKLFINPTLAHFVWLTENVHKPSKAGEQQDDHGSGVSPGAGPQPWRLPGQHRVHELTTAPEKPPLLCTLQAWLRLKITDCNFAHARLGGSGWRVVLKNSHMANSRMSPTAQIQSQEAPAAAAKRQKLSHRDRRFPAARACMKLYKTRWLASSIRRIPTEKKRHIHDSAREGTASLWHQIQLMLMVSAEVPGGALAGERCSRHQPRPPTGLMPEHLQYCKGKQTSTSVLLSSYFPSSCIAMGGSSFPRDSWIKQWGKGVLRDHCRQQWIRTYT